MAPPEEDAQPYDTSVGVDIDSTVWPGDISLLAWGADVRVM